jgi:hypothetical protein
MFGSGYENCPEFEWLVEGSVQTGAGICPEFDDELHSFSTFFALNFDKKLAVE